MRPALLVESEPAIREVLRLRHRHVLVDEYQDVNRASTQLLRAVAGDGARLWVVGDARQSIYRFRGASSANMMAFHREYAGAAADQLSRSYRSTTQIVSAVVAIAPRMAASEGMLPLGLEADRGAGPGRPEIRRYDTLEDEEAGIAAAIRELEGRNVKLKDQAVLCRSNGRLGEIAAALEDRGIAVLFLGSLFEREEIRDLLAVMSLAVDPLGTGLARVGAMARYGLTLQDVYLVTRWVRSEGRFFLTELAQLSEIPGVSPEGAGAAGAGRRFCRGSGRLRRRPGSFWRLICLIDRITYAKWWGSESVKDPDARAIAVWQFA